MQEGCRREQHTAGPHPVKLGAAAASVSSERPPGEAALPCSSGPGPGVKRLERVSEGRASPPSSSGDLKPAGGGVASSGGRGPASSSDGRALLSALGRLCALPVTAPPLGRWGHQGPAVRPGAWLL